MNSTLTTTCSFCRLRFANRPLLELHVREDHPQRSGPAEPGHRSPADAHESRPRVRSSANRTPERATGSSAKARTAGWAMTGLRRVIGAFRRANAELQLASELMVRPAVVPRPRQPADPPAEPDGHQATASAQTDRAA